MHVQLKPSAMATGVPKIPATHAQSQAFFTDNEFQAIKQLSVSDSKAKTNGTAIPADTKSREIQALSVPINSAVPQSKFLYQENAHTDLTNLCFNWVAVFLRRVENRGSKA